MLLQIYIYICCLISHNDDGSLERDALSPLMERITRPSPADRCSAGNLCCSLGMCVMLCASLCVGIYVVLCEYDCCYIYAIRSCVTAADGRHFL